MSGPFQPALRAFGSSLALQELLHNLPGKGQECVLGGALGSAGLGAVAALHQALPHQVFLILCNDPWEAASAEADLDTFLGEGETFLYPQGEVLPYEGEEPLLEVGAPRVEALEALLTGRGRVLVTTFRALQEKSPIPDSLAELRFSVVEGANLGHGALIAALRERGFERAPMVEELGQFAVRGGIVDLFPLGVSDPLRVEFEGDRVASIRTFDLLTQRSIRSLPEAHVLPAGLRSARAEGAAASRRSLLELLPSETLAVHLRPGAWAKEAQRTWQRTEEMRRELEARGRDPSPVGSFLLTAEEVREGLRSLATLLVKEERTGETDLETSPPPDVGRDMRKLRAYLLEGAAHGRDTIILCDNDGQLQRLEEILGEQGLPPRTHLAVGALAGGFALDCSSPPLSILTDHEIFRRSRRLRRKRQFRGGVALDTLSQLSPGDYVVHMDHGVGVFRGLETITVEGSRLEVLAIEYAGGEILRVPVYRIDLVERWIGTGDEEAPPKLHRLGGRSWKTLRRRTEAAIDQLTGELLELYARREAAKGFAFSPDTRWQKEMESSFLYEDTPDQRTATREVKADMESPKPMDRLVCGDVGYGKTEVAIRAAFKAVQDGRQVAVLAPTTILVEQHRRTFGERLADYPVRIEALSRFRSPREQREILVGLAEGQVDIVIGTHRLLSPDVAFKSLGLLVVDEEQRFGVRHKERLKSLRASVDVLTLTATPIPRTLHLALSGLRDLSLIRTPPRDRMPVITHVLPWSDQILGEALQRERDRGGQVFFVHNRVETIHTAASRLRRLDPTARMGVAHGQMPPRELDEVMRRFVSGELDVLVCTSIIENGLDVPNANTLIVDGADRFGLAQLYQIRGRVGRSNRRAYCYLVVPEGVSLDAEKRLRVLEHYTDLGSGYAVALRDLEIRGAGNLLGADQSGFAHSVGLQTYLRLLEETLERLGRGPEETTYPDPEVSLSASALLPDSYISEASQKLGLYRRLVQIRDPAEVEEVGREMRDRFGPLPPEAEALLDATVLRILGRSLGVERVVLREREGRVTFRVGVVPPLARLDRPLEDAQVEVVVRRMDPLSLSLRQIGNQPLSKTLRRAFAELARSTRESRLAG